ncbi:hypothetical protein FNH09_45040, partial [Streptomyces adustus]
GELDAGIVMIGILPTLDRDDLVSSNLSAVDRYTLLNDQIVAALPFVTSTTGSFDRGRQPSPPCSRSLYDECSSCDSSSCFSRFRQGFIRSAVRGNHPDFEPAARR